MRELLMSLLCKKATQDGTYTVYLENQAVAWGLTGPAADAIIDTLYAVGELSSQALRHFRFSSCAAPKPLSVFRPIISWSR